MQTITVKQTAGLKVKTQVKVGGTQYNHNQTLLKSQARGLKVKSQIKAGIEGHDDIQHNETLVCGKALKVKTQVKAGHTETPTTGGGTGGVH